MKLTEFSLLPDFMQNAYVREYYDILMKKRASIFLKRFFDIVFSLILLLIFVPIFIVIAIVIKLDSKGPVIFKQKRVTKNGKIFKILKMRTMVNDAEHLGPKITCDNDGRITKVGRFLRKYRLDELPQVVNILLGDMTFVGTRPEVPEIVNIYKEKMYSTLLLPAGVTSLASIKHSNESEKISSNDQISDYVNNVLDDKMEYNLLYLRNFSLLFDIKIILKTLVFFIKS